MAKKARKSASSSTGSLLSKVENTKKEKEKPEVPLEEMPLENLGDYVRYNEAARAMNKRLGLCRYKVKQCPIELHPKQRIVFGRNDQPRNPLPVYLSNEMIEYKEKLIPGETYDLPLCVIEYLSKKGTPIWNWVDKADGSRETHRMGMEPRFALRTIY